MRYNFFIKINKTVAIDAKSEAEATEILFSCINDKISLLTPLSEHYGYADDTINHEKIKCDLYLKKNKKVR